MILVTGHGRSGTRYASKVFRAAGIDLGHERLGRDGAVSWIWAHDEAVPPWFPEAGSRPDFDVILHQTRHPLKVIASVCRSATPAAVELRAKLVPGFREAGTREAAFAISWLRWNELCEKIASFRYRVEDMEDRWPEILEAAGVEYRPFPEGIPTNDHAIAHHPLSWEQLAERAGPRIAGEVAIMAGRYGYE